MYAATTSGLGALTGERVLLDGTVWAPGRSSPLRWERNRRGAPPWSPRHYTQLFTRLTPAEVRERARTATAQVILPNEFILEGRDYSSGTTFDGDKALAADYWFPGNLEYQLRAALGNREVAPVRVWGRWLASFPGYFGLDAFQVGEGPIIEGRTLSKGDAPPAGWDWTTREWIPYGDRLPPAEEVRRLRRGIDLGYEPSDDMLAYAGGGGGPPLTTEDYVETIEAPRFDADPFGGEPPGEPDDDIIYFPGDPIIDYVPGYIPPPPKPPPVVPLQPPGDQPAPGVPPEREPAGGGPLVYPVEPGGGVPVPMLPEGPLLPPAPELPEPIAAGPGGFPWPVVAGVVALAIFGLRR